MTPAELTYAWAATVVDALVRRGVKHVALCPGSRSAPLALAVAARSELKVWTIPDERSAAFFALGVGMATNSPAALVVTSGTAGANAFPAVIEASMSRVPLIVVTANRPPELHGFGALQTIDQHRLFGGYADFVPLPLPEPQLATHARAMLAKPAGPVVHVDVRFREPLALQPGTKLPAPLAGETPDIARGMNAPEVDTKLLQPRTAIVAGPARFSAEDRAAIVALAAKLKAPILAEAASGLRFGAHETIAHYDALLRIEAMKQRLQPQTIIRVGGPLTTRTLQGFADSAPVLAIAEPGRICDPNHSARAIYEGPIARIAQALAEQATPGDPSFASDWLEADRRAAAALEKLQGEPAFARALVAALPAGCNLMLSNSMPIRDVDAFASRSSRRLEVFSSRGASGIDGITSTAFGIAAATQQKTVLLVGDTAFLHDVGGLLWGSRLGIALAIVVVNNAGGRIFEFLPVAQSTNSLGDLFVMPPNIPLEHVARAASAEHRRIAEPEGLAPALHAALEKGLSVLELDVTQRDTVADHAHAWAAVMEALA